MGPGIAEMQIGDSEQFVFAKIDGAARVEDDAEQKLEGLQDGYLLLFGHLNWEPPEGGTTYFFASRLLRDDELIGGFHAELHAEGVEGDEEAADEEVFVAEKF